jgi:hypothetical protein
MLHTSFIFCDICLSFRWTERGGGITRGKEKDAGREREREEKRE